MNRVIIGLGSNIQPEENIGKVVSELEKSIKLVKKTDLLRTKPIGITDQPDFFNGAVLGETVLELEELRVWLKSLEDLLGRDRTKPKFGPRTIDLDILVWNGRIVDEDYHSRDFIRQLVNELL